MKKRTIFVIIGSAVAAVAALVTGVALCHRKAQ